MFNFVQKIIYYYLQHQIINPISAIISRTPSIDSNATLAQTPPNIRRISCHTSHPRPIMKGNMSNIRKSASKNLRISPIKFVL